jgi:hypothetical protein
MAHHALPIPQPGVSPSWLLLADGCCLCFGAGLILGAFASVSFMARHSNIACKVEKSIDVLIYG